MPNPKMYSDKIIKERIFRLFSKSLSMNWRIGFLLFTIKLIMEFFIKLFQ